MVLGNNSSLSIFFVDSLKPPSGADDVKSIIQSKPTHITPHRDRSDGTDEVWTKRTGNKGARVDLMPTRVLIVLLDRTYLLPLYPILGITSAS